MNANACTNATADNSTGSNETKTSAASQQKSKPTLVDLAAIDGGLLPTSLMQVLCYCTESSTIPTAFQTAAEAVAAANQRPYNSSASSVPSLETKALPSKEDVDSSASFTHGLSQQAEDAARTTRQKELRLLFRPHKKEHHYMAFATAINELAEQEDSEDNDIDSHDNDEILAIELSLLRNIATLLRPRKEEKHFLDTGRDIL